MGERGSTLLWLIWVSLPILQIPFQSLKLVNASLWKVVWLWRRAKLDPSAGQDFVVFLSIEVYTIYRTWRAWILPAIADILDRYIWVPPLLSLVIIANVSFQSLRYRRLQRQKGVSTSTSVDDGPVFLRCRTTHSRIFPKSHSFSYSYFCVGIPVGWRGSVGTLLSVDTDGLDKSQIKKGWFHVQGSDYLQRKNSGKNLKEKLCDFLRTQGVGDDDWNHAYLVTAPRLLGYSFNPVSFWYLYSTDNSLRMMILEVNNTFDERRMYLLKATDRAAVDPEFPEDEVKGLGSTYQNTSATFTNQWAKDFHVSPFNSRKGAYALTAVDPFSKTGKLNGTVDNRIVLKSSKGHAKLVARLVSEGDPLKPASLTSWDSFQLLAQWSWVGLLTFPRISFQAWKLYFRRKLHVWYRPEVMPESIGRRPTSQEEALEPFFRDYLAYSTRRATKPLHVVYIPTAGQDDTLEFYSPAHDQAKGSAGHLEIRVLTPAFYSRFVHYAHTSEAFDRESVFTDERNRTVWVSRPELLPVLFPEQAVSPTTSNNPLDRLRWDLLRRLRCPPEEPSYPFPHRMTSESRVKDVRSFSLSPLDQYVRKQRADQAFVYRRCVTKAFLAHRYAFGSLAAITFVDVLMRSLLGYYTCFRFLGKLAAIKQAGNGGTFVRALLELAVVTTLNLPHVWSMAKGV